MGPVVSDKPRIPKIVVDWMNKVGEKRLHEMTSDDVYKLMNKEFGQYYANLHSRINKDLGDIEQILKKEIEEKRKYSKFSIVWAHSNIGKSWSVENG